MPKLSDTMTEGTLVAWKKKKGEQVTTGEVLAEIETDKATMEWESPEDGVLTEIYIEEGGKVEVGPEDRVHRQRRTKHAAAQQEPAAAPHRRKQQHRPRPSTEPAEAATPTRAAARG
jgi:pyruvate dehydrogenase E2 component (dihydrolipoamide acetyltransferase)